MNALSLRALTLLALPVLALTGCDTGEDGSSDALGGTYTGSAQFDENSFGTFRLTIPNTESGPFAFSGTYEEDGETLNVTGTGVYNHPSVTMDGAILEEDFNDEFRFTGDVDDSRDEITVDWEDITFTLSRD